MLAATSYCFTEDRRTDRLAMSLHVNSTLPVAVEVANDEELTTCATRAHGWDGDPFDCLAGASADLPDVWFTLSRIG